jgi:sugar phosphate isomerase/epimerase
MTKPSSAAKAPPVLKQFVNFWTFVQYPSAAKEWSFERKVQETKKAGFDGIMASPAPNIPQLCEKYGLDFVGGTDASERNFKEKLDALKPLKPQRINVQLLDHDTPPRVAAAAWIKLEKYAEKLGLNVDLEVHRDTCTETPEKTYEIAALYKKATGRKITLNFDFSHLSVIKHLNPPYAERLLVQPDLVQKARQLHLRPFNGHHAQIPATDGRGHATPEFESWLKFAGDLLDCWFAGARGGETVYICPEFGPKNSGYGLSTFPDVWKDAVFTREKIAELWKARVKAFRPKR